MFEDLNDAVAGAFGETVTVRHGTATAAAVRGVFDRRHYAVEGQGAPVSTRITTVSVVDAEAGPLARGDRVGARGGIFCIDDLLPDGQGMTALRLEAV